MLPLMFALLLLPSIAVAEPFTYQFTSGELTGQFVASFGDIMEFTPFKSWNITAPSGSGPIVWDSASPSQKMFQNNQLWLTSPALHLINSPPGVFQAAESFKLNIFPTAPPPPGSFPNIPPFWGDSGAYQFTYGFSGQAHVVGTGEWARVAVPEPSTLWPFLMGLAGVAFAWYRAA